MGSGDTRKHQSWKGNAIKSTKQIKSPTITSLFVPRSLPIMSEVAGWLVVGCGNEIPNATNRRNVCHKPAQAVASLWRHFLRDELASRNQLVLEDSLFSDERGINTKDYGYQGNSVIIYMTRQPKLTRYSTLYSTKAILCNVHFLDNECEYEYSHFG